MKQIEVGDLFYKPLENFSLDLCLKHTDLMKN